MTGTVIQRDLLPAAIEETLRRLIWRVRAVIVLRGVLATLATGLIAILAAMGVRTQWIVVEPWQAYALTGGWLAAAATAAYLTLVRPLARSFTLAGIARTIEARHPELQERLSSTVELLASDDAPEIRGSDALIRALTRQAGQAVSTVRPRKEITFRRARPFLYTLTVAVAGIAAVLAIFGADAGRLLAKTVMPSLNLPNFYAGDLSVSPGQRVIPAGARLEVTAEVTGSMARRKLGATQFRIARPDAPDKVFQMPVQGDGTFRYTTAPLHESIRYRVRAADAVSEYFEVTVVPRPAVEAIEIGYDYPEYTHLADTPPIAARGDITAPVGAIATVRLTFNKPVANVAIAINGRPVEAASRDSRSLSFSHQLAANSNGTWTATLTDEHGFEGQAVQHSIVATPDKPPTARVDYPAETELKLSPKDRLDVGYVVTDDFGVDGAVLAVAIDGRQLEPTPLDASKGVAQTALDLAKLDLSGARKVTFQVRASDARPAELGGPQEGVSDLRTIELDAKAPSYVFQVQLAMDLRVRETLERIAAELAEAKKLSDPLRRSIPATETLAAATVEKIDALRKRLLSAEQDTRALAEVTTKSAYPELSGILTKLADEHIGKARELAGLIKITDERAQRAASADQADYQVGRSIDIVSELLAKFDVLTELARQALKLEELARRQELLAAAEFAKDPPADAGEEIHKLSDEEWREAEREIAKETAELAKRDPVAKRAQLELGKERSMNLAEMARRLQRSQEALASESNAAERLKKSAETLRQITAEQKALAGKIGKLAAEAADDKATGEPAKRAAASADKATEALKSDKPTDAVRPQGDAAKQLDEAARRAAEQLRDSVAAKLADKAEALAKQQDALAKRAQAVKTDPKAIEAADAAVRKAERNAKQLRKQVAARLAELADKQATLSKNERELQEVTKVKGGERVSELMDRVVKALREGDPKKAHAESLPALHRSQGQVSSIWWRVSDAQNAEEAAEINKLVDKTRELSHEQGRLRWQIRKAMEREAPALDKAAKALAGARTAAKQARKNPERKSADIDKAQKKLADEAAKLQQFARKATPQARRAAAKHDPRANMNRASKELQRAQPAKAAPHQKAAAEQLRKMAAEARPKVKPIPAERAEKMRRQAKELAKAQQDLSRRTMSALQQVSRDKSRLEGQELTRLRAEQQKIKRAAAQLADEVSKHAPQPDRIETQAARAAAEASNELNRRRLAQAAEASKRAAKALGETGKRLGGKGQPRQGDEKPPATEGNRDEQVQAQTPDNANAQEPDQVAAEKGPSAERKRRELAGRAEELAKRQQRVAREIEHLRKGEIEKLLASRQQRIAEQTEQVRKDTELIGEHLEDVFPDRQAAQQVERAKASLRQAKQAQQAAERELKANRPGQSVPQQRRSSQALARAYQALAQVGQRYNRQARQQQRPTNEAEKQAADQLADAHEAALEAAKSADQAQALRDADRAAELLAQLASRAAQRARQMGIAIVAARGQQTQAMIEGMSGDPKTGIGLTGVGPGVLADLADLGITGEQWARLPGQLRDQVLQAARQEGPAEYRSLIRRYFKTIAKKAAAKAGGPSK